MSLIGTLGSGVSALRTFMKGLEVIGNNIANVNTTGYKSSTAQYADSFSNILQRSAPATAPASNIPGISVGTGVKLIGVRTSFTQGSLESTGVPTDLGISGDGYFHVKNPVDGTEFATRDGTFRWDEQGYLTTAQGYHVQGGTGGGLATVADIKLGTPPVGAELQSSTSATNNKVLLQNFTDPSSLTKEGNNLYSSLISAGPVGAPAGTSLLQTTGINDPGTNGLGSVQSGTLELSNVDLTDQFANLITTQRSFQAGSRLITVSDTVLDDIFNLKR